MRMGSLMLFIKWRLVLGVFAGAALGLGWYKLVGCGTGTCPITNGPLVDVDRLRRAHGFSDGSWRLTWLPVCIR